MAIFKVENELGRVLQLSGMEHKWQIKSITGLNQPNAALSLSVIPTLDGERLNSARLEKRNPLITLSINGNVEQNLLELNTVIQSKKFLRLYFKSNLFDVHVDGTVESFEYDHFENGKVVAQISLICENPYWISNEGEETTISKIISLLEFPISLPDEGIAVSEIKPKASETIKNSGNTDSPIIIRLEASGKVVSPKITDEATGKSLEINISMKKGDLLIINTKKGSKKIELSSGTTVKSVANKVALPITWLELTPGLNTISITAKSGIQNLTATVTSSDVFGGV